MASWWPKASERFSGIFTGDQARLKIGNVDRFATQGPRPWQGWLDEVRITPEALRRRFCALASRCRLPAVRCLHAM